MQRYKCNVEMVFCGQMNNIVECDYNGSGWCVIIAYMVFTLSYRRCFV